MATNEMFKSVVKISSGLMLVEIFDTAALDEGRFLVVVKKWHSGYKAYAVEDIGNCGSEKEARSWAWELVSAR